MSRAYPGQHLLSASLQIVLVGLMLAATTVSLTLVEPSRAAAQDDETTQKAIARFKEGREAYDKGEFATAVARWEEAFALKPNNKLLIYIARAYDQLDKPGKALSYLEKYASLGSEEATYVAEELKQVRTNATSLSMRTARRELNDAVAIATPGKRGKKSAVPESLEINRTFVEIPFAVTSEPPGASVYVDDKEWGSQGTTPVNLKLFTGRHTIWVERKFHETQKLEVSVRPVQTGTPVQKAAFILQREMVPVELTAIPDNAEITLVKDTGDRLKLGKGQFKGNLPAGETKFFLTATGLGQREFDRTLLLSDVSESGKVHVELDMRSSKDIRRDELSQVGTLRIEGYLIGADVLVNGKVVGQTPRLELQLSPGPHAVDIVKEGFKPISQIVRIEVNQTVTVETPETLEPVDSGVNWAGWLTLTAGVAVAGGGGYFTLQQIDKQNQANDITPPVVGDNSVEAAGRRKEILDLESSADQNGLISYIVYGVGGATALTGIVLLAIGGDEATAVVELEPGLRLEVVPTVGGAQVGFTVTWP